MPTKPLLYEGVGIPPVNNTLLMKAHGKLFSEDVWEQPVAFRSKIGSPHI